VRITTLTKIQSVDDINYYRNELTYLQSNKLHLQNGSVIALINEPFAIGGPTDDFNLYIKGQGPSHFYKLNNINELELLFPSKIDGFKVISLRQALLVDIEGYPNTYTYIENGLKKWCKPRGKRILGFNHATIVTAPDFQYSVLDIRDLTTFTVQAQIKTELDKGFKVVHRSNVIGDTLIFFQRKDVPRSGHSEVIATAINLRDYSVAWHTEYIGAYWFLLNDQDGLLYSLRSIYEDGLDVMYFEKLNPITGQYTSEIIGKGTQILGEPLASKIAKNVLFFTDSRFVPTSCVHAFDLSTKQLIASCDLALAEGVGLAEPYICGNDLWVLDSTKTLHQLSVEF
jgi:hypothetical protein